MATVVQIDDDLAREAAAWAGRTGRSLSQFVEDAIAGELLARPEVPPAETAASGPVVIPTFGGDGIVDGLTLAEAIARTDLEDDIATAGVRTTSAAV